LYSRQYDIPTSLLYSWQREFRYARAARQVADPDSDHAPMFVPVVADSPNPHTWLTETLNKLADEHPANSVGELMP
jgi:hypothetical protein